MTVEQLWQNVLGEFKHRTPIAFQECSGERVGIDISVWLHQLCTQESVTLCMNCQPQYPPTNIIESIRNRHRCLSQAGIIPVYVFDGCHHRMKSVARLKRDTAYSLALGKLQDFYEKGQRGDAITDNERGEAFKWMKQVTTPTHAIINMIVKWMIAEEIEFVGAPFEAEWQLVMLEKVGIINAIMSVDGDCVILGAKKLYMDVKFPERKLRVYRQSEILHPNSQNLLAQYPTELWPLVAAFLGCDYIQRLTGNGPKKVFGTVMPSFLRAGHLRSATHEEVCSTGLIRTQAKDNYLQVLSVGNKQFSGDTRCYIERFWNSVYLFRHCPVISQDNLSLVPLQNVSNTNIAPTNWGKVIGFCDENDRSPVTLLPVPPNKFSKAVLFDGCNFLSIDGGSLPVIEAPTYACYAGLVPELLEQMPLPCFAYVNFDVMPISCTPTSILQNFAASCICTYLEGNRTEIENCVKRMVDHKIAPLPPDVVPKQIGSWVVHEVLIPLPNSEWDHSYFDYIRERLALVGNREIKKIFPRGNESNRKRSLLLYQGGNLDLSTVAFRECECIASKEKIILIKCQCFASMKSRVVSSNVSNSKEQDSYTVYVGFKDKAGTKKATVVRYPYSCCGCCNGRHCCSHVVAVLLMIRHIQLVAYPKEVLELLWPKHPHTYQNEIINIESICQLDKESFKGRQKNNLGIIK